MSKSKHYHDNSDTRFRDGTPKGKRPPVFVKLSEKRIRSALKTKDLDQFIEDDLDDDDFDLQSIVDDYDEEDDSSYLADIDVYKDTHRRNLDQEDLS